jgi:hypothetical protein
MKAATCSVLIALALCAGCAHDSTQIVKTPPVEAGFISITVGGAVVNQLNKQPMFPPFTLEHAIQMAGGPDPWWRDVHFIEVTHTNGQHLSVKKRLCTVFPLVDGDRVYIFRDF